MWMAFVVFINFAPPQVGKLAYVGTFQTEYMCQAALRNDIYNYLRWLKQEDEFVPDTRRFLGRCVPLPGEDH